MNTAVIPLLVGSMMGLALVMLASIFAPARPDIGDTLERLYVHTAGRAASTSRPIGASRTDRLGYWVQTHIRLLPTSVPYRDLEALDIPPARLYATKALLALGGASGAVILGAMQALMGAPSVAIPAAAGILLAVVGWVMPDMTTRAAAAAKREQFVRTVTTYYDLVTLMRLSGATVNDSITFPAHVANAPLFVRIRGTLNRQQLQHKRPWDGLLELADDIDLPELRDLGDMMAISGDRGAPAAATLRAKARDIRGDRLTKDMEIAQRDLQRQVMVQVLLLVTFFAFLAIPAAIRIITS